MTHLRAAIVTGGGGGIGGAAGRLLSERGFAVLIVDLDGERARQTAAAISAAGGEASELVGDVSDPNVAAAYVQTCVDRYGYLSAFFNNAGYEGRIAAIANLGAYCASKHAVIGLTRSAALEEAPWIRVNALAPGPTDTRMMQEIDTAVRAAGGDPASFLERIPMGRYGHPNEVAQFAAWLLAEAPPFLTGAVLPVDDGMTTL